MHAWNWRLMRTEKEYQYTAISLLQSYCHRQTENSIYTNVWRWLSKVRSFNFQQFLFIAFVVSSTMQQSPHVEDGEIPVYSIDGPPLIYASTDFKTLSRTARELRQLKINSTPFTTTASASNHSNDEMNFLKTGQW